MSTENDYAIVAASEKLDKVIAETDIAIKNLDLDLDNEFDLRFCVAELKGIATFLRKKSAIIAEKRPLEPKA